MWRTVRVTMLDPMNMTSGHMDIAASAWTFCQKIFGLLVLVAANCC